MLKFSVCKTGSREKVQLAKPRNDGKFRRQYGNRSSSARIQKFYQWRMGRSERRQSLREPQSREFRRIGGNVCVIDVRGCGRGGGCSEGSLQIVAVGASAETRRNFVPRGGAVGAAQRRIFEG